MFGATALCFVLERGVSCFAYRRISIMSDFLNCVVSFEAVFLAN